MSICNKLSLSLERSLVHIESVYNLRNLRIVLGGLGALAVQIAIQCPKLSARLSHQTTGCDNR